MDLNTLKILIRDQFPEVYRTEYPQLVTFVQKYYEFLNTTEYSVLSTVRDVDTTLDQYVSVLKNNFAKNIPEFGKLPDREFLKFAKEFYTARGSEDSYKFLFRAMFGKEVEIIYPSEYVLKPSDGVWNQEISIRVSTNSDPSIIVNKLIEIVSPSGTKLIIECSRVKRITDNIHDIFFKRTYFEKIEIGDTISFDNLNSGKINAVTVTNGGTGYTQGSPVAFELAPTGGVTAAGFINVTNGVVTSVSITNAGSGYSAPPTATIVGSGQNAILFPSVSEPRLTFSGHTTIIPSSLSVVTNGTGFSTGSVFTVPHDLVLRMKIGKTDTDGSIKKIEIIQPGIDLYNRNFFVIDSITKTAEAFQTKPINILPTQALLELKHSATLKYPGSYTSTNGFLSDVIKLHDSRYYQSYSYIIRLDEQLDSYKNVVKRLLHPSGLALWAEYNMSTKIDIKSTVDTLRAALKLFVEDDVFSTEQLQFNVTLARTDNAPAIDANTFDVELVRTDNVTHTDSGILSLSYSQVQDYCDPTYFAEFGDDAYCIAGIDDVRILYAGIPRPVDDYINVVQGESGQVVLTNQFGEVLKTSLIFAGTPRTVDDDLLIDDNSTINFVKNIGDITTVTDNVVVSRDYFLSDSIELIDTLNFETIKETYDDANATDEAIFDIIFDKLDACIISDTGSIFYQSEQTFSSEGYFESSGSESYSMGDESFYEEITQ